MPWSMSDPPPPAKNWPQEKKRACVRAANAALRDGATDEDAIQACLGAAARIKELEMDKVKELLGRARGQDMRQEAKALIGEYTSQGNEIPSSLWGMAGEDLPKDLEIEINGKALNLGEHIESIRRAFRKQYPVPEYPTNAPSLWIYEFWDSFLIVEEYQDGEETYFQVPYGQTADGFTFPQRDAWVEVEQEWVPVEEQARCLHIAPVPRFKGFEDYYGPINHEADAPAEERPLATDTVTADHTMEGRLSGFKKRMEQLLQELLPDSGKGQGPVSVLQTWKQDDGQYRWLFISNTAVQDREQEVVSRQALQSAVAKMDESGDRGTLDFWHIDGTDLGWCDFQAVHGYALIESGLWSPTVEGISAAKSVMADPDHWAVSIKFRYMPKDTETIMVEGRPILVYNDVDLVSQGARTILPRGKEASLFTSCDTLGGETVDAVKLDELKRLVGEGPAELVLERAEQVPKDAAGRSLVMKAIQDVMDGRAKGDEEAATDGEGGDEEAAEPADETEGVETETPPAEEAIPASDPTKALLDKIENPELRAEVKAALGQQAPDPEPQLDLSSVPDDVVKVLGALANKMADLEAKIDGITEKPDPKRGAKASRSSRQIRRRASEDPDSVLTPEEQVELTGPGQEFKDRPSRKVAEHLLAMGVNAGGGN